MSGSFSLENSYTGDLPDAFLFEVSNTVEAVIKASLPDIPIRESVLASLDTAQIEIRERYISFVSSKDAKFILDEIVPEEIDYYLGRVVHELQKNTGYFKDSAGLSIDGVKLGEDKAPILLYSNPTGIATRLLRREQDREARLLPPLGAGVVFEQCPSARVVLESLLTKGTLPKCLNIADFVSEAAETYSATEKVLLWAPLAARFALVAVVTRGLGTLTGIGTNAATFPATIPFMRSIFGSHALREIYALVAATNSPTWGASSETDNESVSLIAKVTREDSALLRKAFRAIEDIELLHGEDAALHATQKVIREPSIQAVHDLEVCVIEDLQSVGITTSTQREAYRTALIHLHDVEMRSLHATASETAAKILTAT